MKRFVLAAVIAAALGAPAVSHASPCVKAARYQYATTSFKNGTDTIIADLQEFDFYIVGPAQVCADGSESVGDAASTLTIKVNGAVACTVSGGAAFDPFGFGAGANVHDANGCGGDIHWDTLSDAALTTPTNADSVPDVPAGQDGGVTHAPTNGVVTVVYGTVSSGSGNITVPDGTYGLMTHGVGVSTS